jgi:hypothetical protein
VVVFEYPVFEKDIKHEGFEVISLGNKIQKGRDGLFQVPPQNIQKAVQAAEKWLVHSAATQKKLEKNFDIGKRFHDYWVIKNYLLKWLG